MARFWARWAPTLVAAGDAVGHLRQQHGADRDADHADRQLIEAVGVVQRRERAGRQEARDDGVGEQRDLGAGRAEDRRSERRKNVFTSGSNFGQRNTGSRPLRQASPPTSNASSTPASSTPQAAAWPGVGKKVATASVATIEMLSRIGAAAGAANRPSALRMPP